MKKFIKQNKEQIVITIVSILALVVGMLSIGLLKSFIVIGIADLIYISTIIFDKKKVNQKTEKVPNKQKKKRKKRKIWKIIAIIFLIICIAIMLAGCAFIYYIVDNAPEFNPDKLYKQDSTVLYTADGTILTKLGIEKREKVTYDELSEVLIDAIIATEDSRYFQHTGFDLPRFLVASVKQVLTSGGGGASTLTMQVSKNTYTSTEASGIEGIIRKFTDIYMSVFVIEKNYSKEEIMEFYVNAPYLGSGSYGVEQACQTYFGKSASEINLAEAALIAGLFQAPSSYDPYMNPELAEERRQTVLYLMKRHEYINDEEYKIAKKMSVDKLLLNKEATGSSNNYQAFIDTVVEEVIQDTKSEENPNGLDPYVVPMEIYTTINTSQQDAINKIISGETFTWENEAVDAGIMVIDVNTGAITAVGAGRNRVGERQYNTATMTNKQIGSTSKPIFDYAPGIEYLNWSTYTPFIDEEYSYSNGVKINNWDRKFNGFMSLRTALAQSRNIPALKAFKSNKNSNIKSFVTSLGLSPELENGIVHEAHSIGGYTGESPLTMATAYAAFGNGGYYITPHSYTKIIFRDNNSTKEKQIEKTRVMSEETAYIMTDLLQASAKYGLGAQSNIGGAIYGAKTGTSNYDEATIKTWGFGPNSVNDLWVNGVSPDYAISVWYGYKKVNPKYTSTSFTISHRKLFQAVGKNVFKKGSNWSKPSGVIEVEIENETYPAQLPSEFTPNDMKIKELFKSGTEPTEVSKRYSKLDSVTNLKGTVLDNKLTLTWDEVKAYPFEEENINSYLDSLYTDDKAKTSAKNTLLSYNSNTFGSLVYKVYSVSNGEKTLLGTTDKPKYEISVTSSSPTEYIVVTSYTKFTANASDEASVKVSLSGVKAILTVTLNDKENITLNINDKYEEKGIKVMSDDKNVTTDAKVETTITNSKGEIVKSIDTTKVETYKITYKVTFEKETKTVTRNIKIIEA